ncbi:type II toxin-antitoxin system HipA family toxin [Raoultibacter phocaeensis]|uniref:type II toxin-antitoxin system HipA family toxin n=1 Tax=Raoultibacter phocaeensis TaxID=2479841 RepID=UPI00111B8441|nr:type II toxin-antitoxin system HipA family toxin [Raoultibacter phocaeensis]
MRTDVTKKLQDLRHLDWTERGATSGTAGSFLKAREVSGGGTWYYKLSCYDSYRGVYGHECVNEVVASRLMGILGIDHVAYRLVHASVSVDGCEFETWLNRSRSFRKPKEQKLALDTFFDLYKLPGESPLDLCERFGWLEQVQKIMLVDYLIANRDRHGANIEVLRNVNGGFRLAPVFDSGLSFVFSCYDDEARAGAFDPLKDVNANNYLGTRSLEENVRRFVTHPIRVHPIEYRHRNELFGGLDGVLSAAHFEKMWEIVWERWCIYEALCNS